MRAVQHRVQPDLHRDASARQPEEACYIHLSHIRYQQDEKSCLHVLLIDVSCGTSFVKVHLERDVPPRSMVNS